MWHRHGNSGRRDIEFDDEELSDDAEAERGDEDEYRCYTCATDKDLSQLKIRFSKTTSLHSSRYIPMSTTPRLPRVSRSVCSTSWLHSRARLFGAMVERCVHSYRPASKLSIGESKTMVQGAKSSSHWRTFRQKGRWLGDNDLSVEGQRER